VAGMGSTAERALFEAAKQGDAPAIRKLLSTSDRPDVNAKASSGCTALHYGKKTLCTMPFIDFTRELFSDYKRGRDWEGWREVGWVGEWEMARERERREKERERERERERDSDVVNCILQPLPTARTSNGHTLAAPHYVHPLADTK
jgi:hypothetical protein